MTVLVLGDSDGDVTESLRRLAGDRHGFVRVGDADAPKVFHNWKPTTGDPNGESAEFEATQVSVNGMMGTDSKAPARADQPSPTGNDGDLLMDPPAKPRMINGSAKNGWKPKTGEDSREEQE